jgi:hypothetical protein
MLLYVPFEEGVSLKSIDEFTKIRFLLEYKNLLFKKQKQTLFEKISRK